MFPTGLSRELLSSKTITLEIKTTKICKYGIALKTLFYPAGKYCKVESDLQLPSLQSGLY